MQRQRLLVANWKMNKCLSETKSYLNTLKKIKKNKFVKIVIVPPFTALETAVRCVKGSRMVIGAQNVCGKEVGAYTGEISAQMLKDVGALFVIIGHSERRSFFHETDEQIHQKIKMALQWDLHVIFCVGENLREREEGKTKDILQRQLNQGLGGIQSGKQLVIAYEPVWAIGTGRVATVVQIEQAHGLIRGEVEKLVGAKDISILYGGSVKPDTCEEIFKSSEVDGALVGGASLEVKSFIEILNFMH